MQNTTNNQNPEISTAIVTVARTVKKQKPRSAKAMAILAGGVLSVVAAVRVTTAHEAIDLDTPSTQPVADATDAATMPSTAPVVADSHVMDVQYAAAGQPVTAQPETAQPVAAQPDAPATEPAPAKADGGLVADGVDAQGRVTITVNKSAVITTKFPYKRISIGQPEIADFNAIASGTVLITGKKAGTTQLILWDDAERSQVIDIAVVNDIRELQDELATMFPGTTIRVKSLNGAIALSGHVPSEKTAEEVISVAAPYSPKILNFMEIGGGQQVELKVRIAEVSRVASSELGVNLGFGDGVGFGGTNIGPSPFATTGGIIGEALTPGGLGSPGEGGATQFAHLGIGKTAVDVFVDALRQNNLLRSLAEPNLTVISGQNASFMAGGSFPYPVQQASGGGSTTTIQFQPYGVQLNFIPVVLGNGRIRLKIAPDVSELDTAHEVLSAGTEVPGLTERKVETTVEMTEGQTFAIAGLLQNTQSGSKNVTPLLGELPVIGPLFRSVKYQRNETELVVMVTPRLVEAMNPDQVPSTPGEHWRDPSENDLFVNRDLGGEVDVHGATTRPTADGRPATRFHGSYGFAPATNQATGTTDDAQAESTASSN